MLENSFYTNNNVDKQVFNATSTYAGPYNIGQSAFGGIIGYILQPGDSGYDPLYQKGYVVTSADVGSSIWGTSGISITTSVALGTGAANTAAILAGVTARPIAASIAAAVTDGGYSDWYLPSFNEIYKIISTGVLSDSGPSPYWSSSQNSATLAYAINVPSGSSNVSSKPSTWTVRAIRTFSYLLPTTSLSTWQTWTKPEGRTTAFIVCIGGGGGGGAGYLTSTGLARGGGGGGASSAITIAQVPFYSIPDTLYIQVGLGGGGAPLTTNTANNSTQSSQAGQAGGISYVSCYPSTNMADTLLVNSLSGAGGGGGVAATSTGGAGGSAPAALTASATNNPRYLSLCNWVSYAGQAGATGSTGAAVAGNQTIVSNSITTGGAGGGGLSSGNAVAASGSQNSGDTLTSFLKTLSGGSVSGALNGVNGYLYLKPFLSVGGSGGGAISSGAQSGTGGNGALGSGGGGGSCMTSNPTTVSVNGGGNGGNGLVMIISY